MTDSDRNARAAILSRVRRALGREDGAPSRPVRNAPAPAIRPAVSEKAPWDRFAAKLTAVAGEMARVPGLAAVPGAVINHLDRHGLPHRLVASRDAILENIPWPEEIELRHGAARDGDRVSVTGAVAAVAETGSLVVCAGERAPTTLNFLPEDHIVVVTADRIVPYMEDAWARIRKTLPARSGGSPSAPGPGKRPDGVAGHSGDKETAWPRAINFITGPSRTGDIEQTMQLGAHGPQRLMVILVDRNGDP